MGLLLFFWIQKESDFTTAFWISLLLMAFQSIHILAQFSTPDALSTLLILACCAIYYYNNKSWILYFLLVLTILCRIDNLIFAGFLLALKYYPPSLKSVNWLFLKKIMLIITGMAGVFVMLTFLTGNRLEWIVEFDHSLRRIQYFKLLQETFMEIILNSGWPFIAALLIWLRKDIPLAMRQLQWLIIAVMTTRLLLFPSYQDRFASAYILIACMIIVFSVSIKGKKARSEKIASPQSPQ